MKDLKNFLSDTFQNPVNENSAQQAFDKTAEFLFNNQVLSAGKFVFQLTEIEFYVHNSLHIDKYCHKAPEQESMAEWYYHGNGLDFTFGSKDNHASILIRGIKKIQTSEYTSGPQKVLDKLLHNLLSSTKINTPAPGIHFIHTTRPENYYSFNGADRLIVKSTRRGLKPTGDNFFLKPYRYLVDWDSAKHKYAEKERVANSIIENGLLSAEQVNKAIGYNIIKS